MFFQQADSPYHFRAFTQFLDADGWRTDPAHDGNQGIIGQIIRINDPLGAMLFHQFAQLQAAQIRIATAPGSQDTRTNGKRLNVVKSDLANG
jgi:hypothetical protein